MFKNRVVIVTGAAQGIGLHIAQSFAWQGAEVVLSDRNEQSLNTAVQALVQSGYSATAIHANMTEESQIIGLIQQTKALFGRIDVLVNNAGLQHVAPIEDFPTEKFELMIKVMLTAPFIAIKHSLPIMKEQNYGRILNIASINGLVGFAGKAAYNSAKHGVIGLTKVAALESAPHGITVNALCPGYVDTPLIRGQLQDLAATRNVPLDKVMDEVLFPLIPQRRLIDVSEVADYALFLCGDKAQGVTGQAVLLDAGYTTQ